MPSNKVSKNISDVQEPCLENKVTPVVVGHLDSAINNDVNSAIETEVWQWLDSVVIGLNLCPFAKKPRTQQQIELYVSNKPSMVAISEDFEKALLKLSKTPAEQTDTTVFVIPHLLEDFYVYLDFLDSANTINSDLGFDGVFQLASFHPDYQFDGAEADARENLTNRAPYPIIHIIREDSMSRVLKQYPDPELIPERNMDKMEQLTTDEVNQLFPYLNKN